MIIKKKKDIKKNSEYIYNQNIRTAFTLINIFNSIKMF